MNSHTPGPWRVGLTIGNKCSIESIKDSHLSVAIIERSTKSETWANAMLISKAPELLEAVENALRFLREDEYPSFRQELRTLLAEIMGDYDEE